jgi:hypothetical protein
MSKTYGLLFDTVPLMAELPSCKILKFTGFELGVEMYKNCSCALEEIFSDPDNGGR